MPQLPDDPKSDQLNPSARGFENLANLERNTSNTPSNQAGQGGNSQQQVADQERQPRALNDSAAGKAAVGAASAAAGTVGTPLAAKAVQVLGKIKTKKGGIGALIVTALVGLIIAAVGVTGPGLLIVHMSEVMTEKFNSQLASFDRRSMHMYATKTQGTLSGVCSNVVTLKCRYSSMSEKQIKRFSEAGIKVNYENSTLIRGRAKPTSFEFGGKTIPADQYINELLENRAFSSAVHRAYSPKYVTWSDARLKQALSFLGVSKRKLLAGDTDAERSKSIADTTKNGTAATDTPQRIGPDDKKPDGSDYTPEEIDNANKAADLAEATRNNAADIASSGRPSFGAALKRALSGATSALKVTGIADSACGAYGAIQAVSYGAKAVRAVQLARYAMIFHNTASAIKDGSARSEDVTYLGNILTTVIKDAAGTVLVRSATDSFGYKYAAFGDLTAMPDGASRFMAGGGLGGRLSNLTATINNVLGGQPRTVCKTLRNPWVSGASLIGGIALMLIPGVNVAWSAKVVANAVLQASFEVALFMLPPMLDDIVAGVFSDPENPHVGEDAADGWVSGSAELHGTVAKFGGNAPMTIDQAVDYGTLNRQVTARYAEEERLARSPLDPTTKYTLLGSFVSSILPIITNADSFSSIVSDVTTLTNRSVAALSPTTSALSEEQYRASLEACQDFDYQNVNTGDGPPTKIATTPFCNVIYGVPTEYLDTSNIGILDKLAGQYDEVTGEPVAGSAYATFVTNCIMRTQPLGSTGDADQQGSDGSECVANEENKDYYLHWMDARVAMTMDEDDDLLTTTAPETEVPQTPTIPVADGAWVAPLKSGTYRIPPGSRFQTRQRPDHNGVDMSAPMGTPIYAAQSGVVTAIGTLCRSCSTLYLTIDHGIVNGKPVQTQYGHSYLDQILVRVGDRVTAGQQVSSVGNQGNVITSRGTPTRANGFGSHLHFNYVINGSNVDPEIAMQSHGITL